MVWRKSSGGGRSHGWTKDPRYGFRSGRQENSAPTTSEFESKKNIEAMVRAAELKAAVVADMEAAGRRSESVVREKGTIVRVLNCRLLSDSRNKEIALFTDESARIFGCSPLDGQVMLEPDNVGVYLGRSRVNANVYVLGRRRNADVVVHGFIFGERVCYFTQDALGNLDTVS